MLEQTKNVMTKIKYKRTVYMCGFTKSLVTSLAGFAFLLIFNNLMVVFGFPLTPEAQMLFGMLILTISITVILIFDQEKAETKADELDEIFKEINKK